MVTPRSEPMWNVIIYKKEKKTGFLSCFEGHFLVKL